MAIAEEVVKYEEFPGLTGIPAFIKGLILVKNKFSELKLLRLDTNNNIVPRFNLKIYLFSNLDMPAFNQKYISGKIISLLFIELFQFSP